MEVKALGLRGMNNLERTSAALMDDLRIVTPRVVLNADALDGAVLRKRGGHVKAVDLNRPHSLWAGSVMLCAAEGLAWPQALYRVEGERAFELCEVPGPRSRLAYVELNDKVYLGNPHFRAVYNLDTGSVEPWGLPLPPPPQVVITDGELSPGVYSLRYTFVSGDLLGGAGPMVQVRLAGSPQGIRLVNRPANALCWITQQDGGDFFLARLEDEKVAGPYPGMQKLPSLRVVPPPPFRHLAYAFGRMWLASGRRLYYSEPLQYDWFRENGYLPFLEELVMVAPVTGGLFVNSRTSTWYLEGRAPGKMAPQRRGGGAVPGTLTYAQVEGGGYEISRKMSQLPSPVWLGPKGMVVGTHHGHLVHLTEARLKMAVRQVGASLARTCRGLPQVLTTVSGLATAEDPELREIFSRGKLFPPAPLQAEAFGGVVVG
ncbi:MAG: hypothetical protein QME75_12415 [Deltaproteobacteria bacterium]|nr:hypothetical protein [Deltaproteobacteria bacterium]